MQMASLCGRKRTEAGQYVGLWASLTLPPWHYLLSARPAWDSCHIVPWARLTFSLQRGHRRYTTFLSSLPLLLIGVSIIAALSNWICLRTKPVSQLKSRHTWETEVDFSLKCSSLISAPALLPLDTPLNFLLVDFFIFLKKTDLICNISTY